MFFSGDGAAPNGGAVRAAPGGAVRSTRQVACTDGHLEVGRSEVPAKLLHGVLAVPTAVRCGAPQCRRHRENGGR